MSAGRVAGRRGGNVVGRLGGRVIVVGSLNVDLTVTVARFPQPGETLTGSELVRAPGGKSSNQAVAAALLGSTVALVGAVGDDDDGTFALEQARAAGVDVTGVARLGEHATGTAMIVVEHSGENTIIVSPAANGELTPEHVAVAELQADDVLCLCLEVPQPAVLAAARAAHDVGARVVLNLSPFAEVPTELLSATDVLLVNATEAVQLLDDELGAWSETRDRFRAKGVGAAVVTLGGDGAVVLDDEVTMVAAEAVEVMDTTGCGDAFTGAVAHRLARGEPLVEAARFAARVAAQAATTSGAQSSYTSFPTIGQHP